jgi:hypothetical protein
VHAPGLAFVEYLSRVRTSPDGRFVVHHLLALTLDPTHSRTSQTTNVSDLPYPAESSWSMSPANPRKRTVIAVIAEWRVFGARVVPPVGVGDYVQQQASLRARIGKPPKAKTKSAFLRVARTFFRDCQEWEWIPRRFDHSAALGTPRSINALLGLGHGFCTYTFFEQCPHRIACARCDFYTPKASSTGQLLEAKDNLQRMLATISL